MVKKDKKPALRSRNLEVAAFLLTALSIIYWTAYALSSYNNFENTPGGFATDFFWRIFVPGSMHGFQSLIFGNHIAPDQALLIPIYAILPSALTLLVMQGVVFSLTGLLVFYICRDLLKNDLLATTFCFAFLASWATQQIIAFEYYNEFMILPFFMLTFWAYQKLDKRLFCVSSLLLVGAMDIATVIAGALGLGLLAQTLIYEKNKKARKEKIILSICLMALGVAVLAFYNYVYYSLNVGYAGSSFIGTPPLTHVMPFLTVPIYGGLFNTTHMQGQTVPDGFLPTTNINTILHNAILKFPPGMLSLFFQFGPTGLFAPIIAFVTNIPWFGGLLLNPAFGGQQFNAFFVGGALIAAILGTPFAVKITRKYTPIKEEKKIIGALCGITIAFVIISYAIGMIYMKVALPQQYNERLFYLNPTQQTAAAQLNSILNQLPANASVMATNPAFYKLTNRKYNALWFPQYYAFVPNYIVFDMNSSIYGSNDGLLDFIHHTGLFASVYNQTTYMGYNFTNIFAKIYNGTETYPYALVAKNGTAMLYKRIG